MKPSGVLYMIPVTLGETPVADILPPATLQICNRLTVFIVENAKSARQFLKLSDPTRPVSGLTLFEIDKHSGKIDFNDFFAPLLSGIDTGFLSEAGMPGIADPGAEFSRKAHELEIRVVPLTGPSSVFLALAASGFSGQNFLFHGYLPKENDDLIRKLQQIETAVLKQKQTQIFIETPYRNEGLFQKIIASCNGETSLCIAREISLPGEYIRTKKIKEWKREKPELKNRPVVFLIG